MGAGNRRFWKFALTKLMKISKLVKLTNVDPSVSLCSLF